MKAKIIKLTPSIAKDLLKFNTENRKLRSGINFFTNQMRNGEWKENGEPIIVDVNGIIKDGQHRLYSVIASGHSYNVPLITDVESDVMDTIDTGFNRSLGDILELNGFNYTSILASIIKSIMRYNFKQYDLNSSTIGRDTNNYVSNTIGLNFAKTHKFNLEKLVKLSYNQISKHQLVNILTVTEIALYLYIIGGYAYEREHIDFIKRLVGNNTIEGTANYWLFKKLASFKKDKISISGKWKVYALIKAWNIFVKGDIPINRMSININNPLDKVLKL